MSDKKIKLKIITHESVVFEGEVDGVYTKGVQGDFGVLPGHIPFMTTLDIGVTRVQMGDEKLFFSTIGGAFQFKNNEAVILTQFAQNGKDVDVAKEELEKQEAEAKLGSAKTKEDIKVAEDLRARAMAQLKAASKMQ
ncbi:ATP synthase F1 subunit epsilon [bacterium]|nr:ATP synthase F1 subunit epsilon [bacterium]